MYPELIKWTMMGNREVHIDSNHVTCQVCIKLVDSMAKADNAIERTLNHSSIACHKEDLIELTLKEMMKELDEKRGL